MFPSTSNLATIPPLGSGAESPTEDTTQAMSAGEIASIVVSTVIVSIIVTITTLFFLRKWKRAALARIAADRVAAEALAQPNTESKDSSQMDFKSELPTENAVQPKEMSAESTPALSPGLSEMAASPKQPSELSTDRITSWDSRTTAATYELPANEIQAAELQAQDQVLQA